MIKHQMECDGCGKVISLATSENGFYLRPEGWITVPHSKEIDHLGGCVSGCQIMKDICDVCFEVLTKPKKYL